MGKPKLVIIEGPDGTGKTTQAKRLAEILNARLISQPSSDNIVGFIRTEAKGNKTLTGLERQLMIAISHTVDAFTKFGQRFTDNVVMDRSYLSGMVYGKLTGLDGYELALLTNILSAVYKNAVGETYDVRVVFLTGKDRLDKPDNDVFEQTIKWPDLRDEYNEFYKRSRDEGFKLFSETERVTQVSISGKTIEQMHEVLVKLAQ